MYTGSAILAIIGLVLGVADHGDEARWLSRHGMREALAGETGLCVGLIGDLPEIVVTPDVSGTLLVRQSIPFRAGALPVGLGIEASWGDQRVSADVRVLTRHPGTPVSARRALITFPFRFETSLPHQFMLRLVDIAPPAMPVSWTEEEDGFTLAASFGTLRLTDETVLWTGAAGPRIEARLIAPPRGNAGPGLLEVVEHGAWYYWVRLLAYDDSWPRIIEARLDATGGIAVWAHVQRLESGNGTAPDLGWEISGASVGDMPRHGFEAGVARTVPLNSEPFELRFPRAHLEKRGYVESVEGVVRFRRCIAEEAVAFQESAWRSAAFVLDPADAPTRNALLEYEVDVNVAPEHFDALYDCGLPSDLSLHPLLADLRGYTRRALRRAMARGDDLGNVTAYHRTRRSGAVHGMNRLNHCPPIFFEAWRSGDRELRDTALLWCENMHAVSLWWGDTADFGGTRYNNAVAAGDKSHEDDPHFMWRTNDASHFCTKGFDAFFLAYEETGCPRMLAALDAQVAYGRQHIHTDRGEARNIGDVADFMALYRYTGLPDYHNEALRLFRALRERVGDGYLFSQSGRPIVNDLPFIDNDAAGYAHPFGKPYIMGYALAGLPALLDASPEEAGLAETIRAVAHFQASAQDLVGGWRYPHPRSSSMIIDQGMEHSAQLARAATALSARDDDIAPLLTAVERTLRARLSGYLSSGSILSALAGWERSTGALEETDIHDLYARPEDRDPSRDYTEGTISAGGACPEGLAHFFETLDFYLAHRPAERLYSVQEPLTQVIERMPDWTPRFADADDGRAPVTIIRDNAPPLTLDLTTPFANKEVAIRESGPKIRVITSQSEDFQVTKTTTLYPQLAEYACTVFPKRPGVAQSLPFSIEVSDLHANSRVYLYDGEKRVAPGQLHHAAAPVMLALAISEDDYAGILLPPCDALQFNTSDEGWQMFMALNARGDGPTTLRGYVLFGDLPALEERFHYFANHLKEAAPYPGAQVVHTAAYGMRAMLPAFHEARMARMDFPLAYENAGAPFDLWRRRAREAHLASMLSPPPRAPFAPMTLAVEDRGRYEARKIAFNISSDERVIAYLLIPKGDGPFPALLALHDHGAHFTIGKEKVVRPFDVAEDVLVDAQQWVEQYYGGNFIGDVLAERGYVVFATDALFWGDRGRFEGAHHAAQQELAANLLQMGHTWAGILCRDDMRSAEFVRGLPETDPERVGCLGLSMGAHRTWNLCAATDMVKTGAAICWIGDTQTLLREGNNQTRGQSAYSMIFPGLRNLLDYPHVAAIACPKPMLFFNGADDGLFPIPGVEAAYTAIEAVYASQGVEERLYTRIWPVAHLFNQEMQDDAFAWLDKHLKKDEG